ILDVVRIVEQPPADAQDHRAVPRHDRLKRDLIALAREPRQELPLRQTRYGPPAEQPLNRPQNAPGPLTNRHFPPTPPPAPRPPRHSGPPPSPLGGHAPLTPPNTAGRAPLNVFFPAERENDTPKGRGGPPQTHASPDDPPGPPIEPFDLRPVNVTQSVPA